MKRYGLVILAGVMMLAVGCSSGNVTNSTDAAETSAAAAESSAEDGSDEMKEAEESIAEAEESIMAAEESIAEAEESIAEAEESLAEIEESLSEAEEEAEEDGDIPYDELTRTPDDYKGKNVTYYGTVVQAVSLNSKTMQLLLAVDEDDSTRLVGEYAPSLVDEKLAKGDTVTVSGKFEGVMRYRMGSGEKVSLPSVTLESIDIESKAETEETEESVVPTLPASSDAAVQTGAAESAAVEETTAAEAAAEETTAAETTAAEETTAGTPDYSKGPGAF